MIRVEVHAINVDHGRVLCAPTPHSVVIVDAMRNRPPCEVVKPSCQIWSILERERPMLSDPFDIL